MTPCEFVEFVSKAQEKINTEKKVLEMEKVLDTYRESTRRRIMRLIEEDGVDFVDGKFVYKENGADVDNIKVMKKYGGDDDDGFDDDFSDHSGSYKNLKID